MSSTGGEPGRELEELLEFFYRTPVGLIDFDDGGRVRRINPASVNLLAPVLAVQQLDDLFEALAPRWPELAGIVAEADHPGRLVDDHHLLGEEPVDVALSCTLVRLGPDRNMLVITDGTTRIRAEQQRDELLASEQEARRRIEVLERNATHMASATTVEEVVRAVLEELDNALELDLTAIHVLDGDAGTIRVYAGPSVPTQLAQQIETRLVDDDRPGPVAIRRNEPIHLETTEEIRERFPLLLTEPRYPLRALLALPLRSADKEAIGALVVTTHREGLLPETVMLLLNGIAGQLGQAIERALLYEQVIESQREQRAVAVRLQEALLPDAIVEHPDLRIASRYRAAADHLTVGGDWYDTFAWPDGRIGVIVGDVAGHDLEAAAAMGRLRAAVAALAPRLAPSPGAVLEALDQFAAGPDGTSYATACCVVIDPATGRVEYASAGHPPPLVVQADGTSRWLTEGLSLPIGPVRQVSRSSATTTLDPGAVIIAYSDGLIERRDEVIDEGMDRLLIAVRHGDRSDCAHLLDEILAATTDRLHLEDDVIVVAAAWTPRNGTGSPSS